MTIPTWAIPVIITLFVGVLTFAWRLAVRAERLTDKLQTLVERLGTMEARLAAIATLEGIVVELRGDHRLLRDSIAHERELRERDSEALHSRLDEVARRSTPTPR